MNYLIGKVGNEYKRILSREEEILETFDLGDGEAIDFSTHHILDANEIFRISDFSQTDYYIQPCNEDYSTVNLAQINNQEYRKIAFLCILKEGQRLFNRITPTQCIGRKTWLSLLGEPTIVEQNQEIELKSVPDAVYVIEDDALYFKDLGKISSIFPGIDNLFREATQEEVDQFCNHNFIHLDGFEPTAIGQLNRKRIASIGAKFTQLPDNKRTNLIVYAEETCGLTFENGVCRISNDTDLKNLLFALDERYYRAEVYEENRIASSIRLNLNNA